MKITSPISVMKGQNILPDSSTLQRHGFTDGSTVNIVTEPEKEIKLRVKLGPKEVTCSVINSMRMRDMKQKLVDGGIVGFSLGEFTLRTPTADIDRMTNGIPSQEELPLHLCGISDNVTLKVVSETVMIQLVTHSGDVLWYTFPRTMTINQMKVKLEAIDIFFSSSTPTPLRMGLVLFLQTGNGYRKLEEGEEPIDSILSDDDVIHCIEDRIFRHSDMVDVYYRSEKIGLVGVSSKDTVLTLKLRAQHQLGFPVSSVDVRRPGSSYPNKHQIRSDTRPTAIYVS